MACRSPSIGRLSSTTTSLRYFRAYIQHQQQAKVPEKTGLQRELYLDKQHGGPLAFSYTEVYHVRWSIRLSNVSYWSRLRLTYPAGAFNQQNHSIDLPCFGARPAKTRMLETLPAGMRPKKKAQTSATRIVVECRRAVRAYRCDI